MGRIRKLHRALDILSNIERTLAREPVPPCDERLVISCRMADLPIDLRHTVVYPAIVDPQQHVGIKIIVVLKAVGLGSVHGITLLVAIDAERRNAELHPRLTLMTGLRKLLDKPVDIVPAPVVDILQTVAVMPEEGLVRDHLTRCWIGIEIVIDMQSVDIIPRNDVVHDLADVLPVLLEARIEDELSVISEHTAGTTDGHVVVCQLGRALRFGPIGVDPRMQFHPAAMTFSDHPLQGIPEGLRHPTLKTGQKAAPRFQRARIERIALGTNLKNNGIHPVLPQLVQLQRKHALHGLCTKPLKLPVHALDPCTAEFPLVRQLRRCVKRIGQHDHHKHQKVIASVLSHLFRFCAQS